MAISDLFISNSYPNQLASLYTNIKLNQINLNKNSRLYINLNQAEIRIFDKKKEARQKGFQRLHPNDFRIGATFDESNPKIIKAAVKALIYPKWGKTDTKIISQLGLQLSDRDMLTEQKVGLLNNMLDHIQTLNRSYEGGTGVFFLACGYEQFNDVELKKIEKAFPSGVVIIKFVKNADSKKVALADRFLKVLEFKTPRSKTLDRGTPLGQKFIQSVLENIESMEPDLRKGILKQTEDESNTILVMKQVSGSTLRQIQETELLTILEDKKFLRDLGKMIFLDAFMGNSDRLTKNGCNLGNIMVDIDYSSLIFNHLNLIDQIFKITTPQEMISYLQELRKGIHTETILSNFKDALEFDREEAVKLTKETLEMMQPVIIEGMDQGATSLKKVLSERILVNRIFQDHRCQEARNACRLIKKIGI